MYPETDPGFPPGKSGDPKPSPEIGGRCSESIPFPVGWKGRTRKMLDTRCMLLFVAKKLTAEDKSRIRACKSGYGRALRLAAKKRREALASEARARKAAERLEARE